MKYFVPQLETDIYFQSGAKEKLGGLPVGLQTEMYPVCKECKNPMSLLAQFMHHDERLPLGKNGRVLFVFQCNNQDSMFSTCATWDAESGANACFIIEPENTTDQVEEPPNGKIDLNKEFWIKSWNKMDDGIIEKEAANFLNIDKYENLEDETAEEIFEKVSYVTKLGSIPSWIQHPEIPKGNWNFIGQLDDITDFNFGDAGIGYIFVEKVENVEQLPKGKFLWQCG